ncbi:hypothetical protein GCM10011374_35660 [Kocuria dechangensis]|uniref:Uncharacterized protein n=1 Tax=Kocuria dechangensis TaxID=1176249 RepID=A0A917H6K3_9MICC|nr:hypothetical protein [Kocuria dechangensis]GGG68195.1 hypothetical protein GCM10011374_35660 [Kocuria dechangensis]
MDTLTTALQKYPLPVARVHGPRLGFGALTDEHGDPVIRFAVDGEAAFTINSTGVSVVNPDLISPFEAKTLSSFAVRLYKSAQCFLLVAGGTLTGRELTDQLKSIVDDRPPATVTVRLRERVWVEAATAPDGSESIQLIDVTSVCTRRTFHPDGRPSDGGPMPNRATTGGVLLDVDQAVVTAHQLYLAARDSCSRRTVEVAR